MKLETFFKKFDQVADAPNAVAKMRELLIHLAVDGKLVPNNPAEKPVGLKLSGTSDDDSSLPANWRSGFFGDAFSLEYGDNLPAPTRSGSGEYPVYGSNGIVGTHNAYLTREPAIIVGRKGSAGALNIATGPSWTTDVAYFVRPPSDLDLRFTYYLLSSLRLDELGKGIKPGLSRKETYALPIALPPLAEQKRIVGKVDELIALCDRLEAQQQERETRHAALARASLARFADAPTPANLHHLFHPAYTISPADLRKSILTLAVQGKLVPQDPDDQPASELYEQIQAEQAQQQTEDLYRTCKPLPPIGEDEKSFPLPLGWEWFRLRSFVFTLGDGLHGTPEYSEGTNFHFINGNNLIDGRIVIKPHTKTVSFEEMQKYRKLMTSNTVLVSINGTLGNVAFYNNEDIVLGKSACYFNLSELVDKHFVRLVIESQYFVNYAIENATGTTIRNLGLKAMNYFPVPFPPLAEQRRIVAKVGQLMALVDQLEMQLAASRATAEKLMEALIAELTA